MIIWPRTFWDGTETEKINICIIMVPRVHSRSGMEMEIASNWTRKIWTETEITRKPRRIRCWGSRRHPCAPTYWCCHAPGAACLIDQDKSLAIPASFALQEKPKQCNPFCCCWSSPAEFSLFSDCGVFLVPCHSSARSPYLCSYILVLSKSHRHCK